MLITDTRPPLSGIVSPWQARSSCRCQSDGARFLSARRSRVQPRPILYHGSSRSSADAGELALPAARCPAVHAASTSWILAIHPAYYDCASGYCRMQSLATTTLSVAALAVDGHKVASSALPFMSVVKSNRRGGSAELTSSQLGASTAPDPMQSSRSLRRPTESRLPIPGACRPRRMAIRRDEAVMRATVDRPRTCRLGSNQFCRA
jgi:hypothetical protein